MVDLKQLENDIAALGTRIRELKAAPPPVDAAAVSAAVQELMDQKKLYAEHNHGIGVDGKPYSDGTGKSNKKKDKQATNDGDGNNKGPSKQVCVCGFFVAKTSVSAVCVCVCFVHPSFS